MLRKLHNKTYEALKWSEKYTKTDMIYLAKGGFWVSLNQVIAMSLGLGLSVAFANLIPKETFGTYKFILALAGVVSAFSLTGMAAAVTQAVARGFDGALPHAFKIQLKWNILPSLFSLIGSLYYFVNDNITLSVALLFVAIFLPISLSSLIYNSYLEGKRKFKELAFYNAVRNAIPVFLIILTIFFSDNVLLLILAYLVSTSIPLLIIYFKINRKYKLKEEEIPGLVNFGIHMSFINFLSSMAKHLDNLIVFHYLGAAQLAIYAFAIAIPIQLSGVSKILQTLILPKLSSQPIRILQKTIYHKAAIGFLLGIALLLIYIPLAPIIYGLLFPQYLESVIFSQVFALVFLFIPATLFVESLVAHKRKKELYILQIVTPLSRIALLLVLPFLYGIWGVIFAILLTKFVSIVTNIILFRRIAT